MTSPQGGTPESLPEVIVVQLEQIRQFDFGV